MATSGWSCVSKENTNFARLCKLLIDGGTHVLRTIFDSICSPPLTSHLVNPRNLRILTNLKNNGRLFQAQWDKLYPASGGSTVTSGGFDITLLVLLLRNICYLTPPASGWSRPPLPTSTNRADDIVRIKLYRNELYGHIPEPAISDTAFSIYWNDIETVLLRLSGGHYKADIEKLKIVSMDPEAEKHYIQCLDKWAKNEERVLKTIEAIEKRVMQKLGETHHKLAEKMDETQNELIKIDETQLKLAEKMGETEHKLATIVGETHHNLAEKMDETQHKLDKVTSMLETSPVHSEESVSQDAEIYSQNLKKAIKHQTEMQPECVSSSLNGSVKTDDIFTSLLIHHGRRKSSQPDLLDDNTNAEISNYADIFLDKTEQENPKSILVLGNPGIGKSLLSQKIVRDWAHGCLFDPRESTVNPDIKFTFLITFKQLNLLAEQELNLSELLNRSSILDENTMTKNSLMEYIIQHPGQLFILIDGYNEYQDRHKIVSDFESQFPNDPRFKMPVAALASKLVQKKTLRESVLMITSRPGEAHEMERLHFDRFVEITGFSEQHVIEYVGKYFKSNEVMKNKALDNIRDNEEFLSFGRVPLFCFFMCIYIESDISKTAEAFPKLKLTEFYCQMTEYIERNYNKAMSKAGLDKTTASVAVHKTLDKLSQLAAQLIVDKRFSFDEEDLQSLHLTPAELSYLKSSSLLCCIPGARNSLCAEVILEFSFCHDTVKEYLAARSFVQNNEMPGEKRVSNMVLKFMVELMDPEKDEILIKDLLGYIDQEQVEDEEISLKYLYEYGDKPFMKSFVRENHNNRYWNSDGEIEISQISSIDGRAVATLVDIISTLNHPLSPVPDTLSIRFSPLTRSALHTLFTSLCHEYCTIIRLLLSSCNLNDACVQCLSEYLPNTKITKLSLDGNKITYDGVMYLLPYCNNLTDLNLSANQLSDEHGRNLRTEFKDRYPGLSLIITLEPLAACSNTNVDGIPVAVSDLDAIYAVANCFD